jgi:hypothetical protein
VGADFIRDPFVGNANDDRTRPHVPCRSGLHWLAAQLVTRRGDI